MSWLISGIFGIGGGAVLLPPVGIAAALEYYRHGNVDFKVALIVASGSH